MTAPIKRGRQNRVIDIGTPVDPRPGNASWRLMAADGSRRLAAAIERYLEKGGRG